MSHKSLDLLAYADQKGLAESRRQMQICNACRYCEGYCAVFPAMTRQLLFSDSTLIQLANLCHNCRGCYYACQYIPPHEFAVNLPAALAATRHDSWKICAWPRWFAKAFDYMGLAIATLLVATVTGLLWFVSQYPPPADSGAGFYQVMAHATMLAIFTPAFVLPLFAMGVAMRRYWRLVGAGRLGMGDIWRAMAQVLFLRQLGGGHGKGCNFEDQDRYSQMRRIAHHATMYGFLLCFASTTSGTILHYVFHQPAPYGFWSAPKLFGVPGGILLCLGTAMLAWLKVKADKGLGLGRIWGGEMAFILLLFFVSFTGLVLYAATGTGYVEILLPLHLATVLSFFLLIPYSKMAHAFYRTAALLVDATATQ